MQIAYTRAGIIAGVPAIIVVAHGSRHINHQNGATAVIRIARTRCGSAGARHMPSLGRVWCGVVWCGVVWCGVCVRMYDLYECVVEACRAA
jgi:hypothetical protein